VSALHILLVDDSEADQFLWRYILEQECDEWKIHTAYDGQEALEYLKKAESRPDIILVDVNMPGMNGFDFLEAYSQMTDDPAPVSMLTSFVDPRDQARIEQYGFVRGCFSKPLRVQDIKTFIEPAD